MAGMYYFLVNPASRSGRAGKCWERIEEVLKKRGISYKVHFTRQKGDMKRLARELTLPGERADEVHLVVLGGDGTVNEAVSGIQDFASTRFSFIPTGSGNDLARDMGISRDPVKALAQLLRADRARPMDVGSVHYNDAPLPDQLFVDSAGIGFDAGVCREVQHSSIKTLLNRFGLGKLAYLFVALRQLLKSPNAQAELDMKTADGRMRHVRFARLMFTAFMSHRFEGGGFQFSPQADASDGLLDLCIVHDVPRWKVLLVLPTAFWGGHYRFREVTGLRGSWFRIRTTLPLWVHTDGEVAASSCDITVTCHKKLLRFYY